MKDFIKKYSTVIMIILAFIIAIFFSYKFFETIPSKGVDLNNVYYIFSTGAQTIAGLVGFVLAAYTFNHQFMWNVRESDDGKTEIIDEAIREYYNYILVLSISTGMTLIADLFMLQFNAMETTVMKTRVYMVVGSMNVAIIIGAFVIALYIIRPINIEEWAQKMLKKHNKGKGDVESTVNFYEFISKYIELEKLCRDYLNKDNESSSSVSLMAMAGRLRERAVINVTTYLELVEVSKYRNLVVHGHVSEVDQEMYSKLVDLYHLIDKQLRER
ncbi:TPA: hypothetical protein QCX62_003722 [Bacillus paranthracis]|nr:hypothetical protein [Bacillus paranthracis]